MENQRQKSKELFDKRYSEETDMRFWFIWKKAFDLGVAFKKKELDGEKEKENNNFVTFQQYLIMVGIRSHEYTHSDDVIFANIDYFKRCHSEHLSAYKALLFFNDYLKHEKK